MPFANSAMFSPPSSQPPVALVSPNKRSPSAYASQGTQPKKPRGTQPKEGPSGVRTGCMEIIAKVTTLPGKDGASPEGKLLLKIIEDPNGTPLGKSSAVYMDHVLTEDDRTAAKLALANAHNSRKITPQSLGLPTVGTKFDNADDRLSPFVQSTMQQTMCVVGVPKVSGIDKWVKATNDGKMENQHKTGNLFFSAIPHSDEGMPSLDNRLGSPEMMEVAPGKWQMNPKFWYEQIFQGGRAKKMELAAFIPTFLLSEEGKIDHNQAIDVMSQNGGIGLGGEYFKLILWNSYAWVFKNLMEMPLTKEARMRGFWPLFLLKQAINQKKTPDGAHAHLSTTDKNGKSALMIVGYWKDRSGPNDERFSDIEFLSLSVNGSYPTIAYKGNSAE